MTTITLTEAERIVLTGVLLKQIERYDIATFFLIFKRAEYEMGKSN